MKRDVLKLVGGILLAGVVILVFLTACGGTTPASSGSKAAAASAPTPAAGASLPTGPVPDNKASGDLLAKGKLVFEKTAGGTGCASCHGLDGKGTTTVGAPDIRGASEPRVRGALAGGVAMMSFIKLSDEEITAMVAYLGYLNEQP